MLVEVICSFGLVSVYRKHFFVRIVRGNDLENLQQPRSSFGVKSESRKATLQLQDDNKEQGVKENKKRLLFTNVTYIIRLTVM